MDTYAHIVNITSLHPRVAIALGTFDGIHIGHQQVIGGAVRWAKQNRGASAVFTFSNHPLSHVAPAACPPLIYPNEVKARIIADMGVDILFNIPFTPELLQLSPGQFIELLHRNISPRQIMIGPNYSFGYKGKGTPELLREKEKELGCEVQVFPAVTLSGSIVSSTSIRQYLSEGHMEEAAKLLGRRYGMYNLMVVTGDRRGRTLGYPTANLEVPTDLLTPPNGVYAVEVRYNGRMLKAVANIGVNPTFGVKSRRIEVHILNFAEDIYEQKVDLLFYKRLRGETKFSDVEHLKRQIGTDIGQALKILSS